MVTMCASARRITDELAKCLPRCIRCHRRVTQATWPSQARKADRLPPSWRRRFRYQDRVDELKVAWGCPRLRLEWLGERPRPRSCGRSEGGTCLPDHCQGPSVG
jgi:hypothetical protein